MNVSALQTARYAYKPKIPTILKKPVTAIKTELGKATEAQSDRSELRELFSHTYGKPIAVLAAGKNPQAARAINVGVILSGGQAPGGHNVIAGLYDGIKKGNPRSKLIGFLGGPSGLIKNRAVEISAKLVDEYRNTGGFDIIGSGRTKIESDEQFEQALATAKKRRLRALVVIGGDDSNTNAALLAEFFQARGEDILVIGVPKTIDGDLKNEYIEASFGFDTAVKTYSELIGNICRDAVSAKKYWHFIKLMGRSASHIGLECALQTQPTVAFVSEEVAASKQTLSQLVDELCGVIQKRASAGANFGVVLVPEGLIEFVPEMKGLIDQINDVLADSASEFAAQGASDRQAALMETRLAAQNAAVFRSLPDEIRKQLLMDRDPHGNVQVSRIETEKLLIGMVESRLKSMKAAGTYEGSFSWQAHFFGYEGRCAFPSNFDADYCYSLGFTAFLLIASGLTGYLSSVRNLCAPARDWIAGGIPLTMMMNLEQRHGKSKPVIKKALVDLNGKPFRTFAAKRAHWALKTSFVFPGAIQYYGPDDVCNQPTKTLLLERGSTRSTKKSKASAGAASRSPQART